MDPQDLCIVKTEIAKEIGHLREIVELHRELVDQNSESMSNALVLRTEELNRRLDLLNGEAGRLREIQTRYLPRETFDAEHKALLLQVSGISKLVYIGLGVFVVLQVGAQLLLHFIQ